MTQLFKATIILTACLHFPLSVALSQEEKGIAVEKSGPLGGAVIDKTLIDDVSEGVQALKRPQVAIADVEATSDEKSALYEKFTRLLTGAKMRGKFTVDGKPMDKLTEETYEISKVEKLPEGDQWVVTARIKYGTHDLTFPVPLEVKWAGSTPVMTLDNMTIPGFGTFGARVVFHKDKYAGTWSHDEVGGHMFGTVELGDETDAAKENTAEPKAEVDAKDEGVGSATPIAK